MAKNDNSGRLEEVGEKDWRKALDELTATAYLRWRLRGMTRWSAHSEKELGDTGTGLLHRRKCGEAYRGLLEVAGALYAGAASGRDCRELDHEAGGEV